MLRPADVAALRRVRYFAALPAVELRVLAGRCTTRTLAAGVALFEEGEPCRGLLIVAEGRVDVLQMSTSGREQIFHTEGPGATLGEGPLFDGGRYIASAVAVEPVRALFLPRAVVRELCRRRPHVALAMLEALARRVRSFADIVSDLAFRSVTQRVARYLETMGAAESSAGRRALDLQVTHTQLAARLGTVRELVARAFAQLERAGAIRRAGKRVVIRDRALLHAVAHGDGRPQKSSRR